MYLLLTARYSRETLLKRWFRIQGKSEHNMLCLFGIYFWFPWNSETFVFRISRKSELNPFIREVVTLLFHPSSWVHSVELLSLAIQWLIYFSLCIMVCFLPVHITMFLGAFRLICYWGKAFRNERNSIVLYEKSVYNQKKYYVFELYFFTFFFFF